MKDNVLRILPTWMLVTQFAMFHACTLPTIAEAQTIVVSLYYVDIKDFSVEEKFFACSDSNVAGPFMSGSTAVDWRNEFAPDAEIIIRESDDYDACLPPPAWYLDSGVWHTE